MSLKDETKFALGTKSVILCNCNCWIFWCRVQWVQYRVLL